MPEIIGDITIYNFIKGLIMPGSLWGGFLAAGMLALFTKSLTQHSRNILLVKSFRKNSLHNFNRRQNLFSKGRS